MWVEAPPVTKRCHKYGGAKQVNDFNRDASTADGLQRRCRDCERRYRQANRIAIAVRRRRYRLAETRSDHRPGNAAVTRATGKRSPARSRGLGTPTGPLSSRARWFSTIGSPPGAHTAHIWMVGAVIEIDRSPRRTAVMRVLRPGPSGYLLLRTSAAWHCPEGRFRTAGTGCGWCSATQPRLQWTALPAA